MTKTIRTDGRECAHIWAHGGQAQNSNRQFYTDGKMLLSYGQHFVAGYLIEPNSAALISGDSRSVTTSKHISYARQATCHFPVCHVVPDLTRLVGYIESGADSATRQAAVQVWLRENFTKLDESAFRYIGIKFAGLNGKRLTTLIARLANETAKKEEENKARREKLENERLTILARQIEKGTIQLSETGTILDESGTIRQIREIESAARLATKKGFRKQATACRDMARELKARLKAWRDSAAMRNRHATVRRYISNIRQRLGRQDATAWQIESALGDMRAVANVASLGGHGRLLVSIVEAEERAHDLRVAERKEEMERNATRRAAWLAGDPVGFHGTDENGRAYLRAVGVQRSPEPQDGNARELWRNVGGIVAGTLETSQGARVPLVDAIRAFRLISAVKDKPSLRDRATGQRVGHYTIDRVDADGNFKAGCHRIAWSECLRLAESLGVPVC